MTDIKDVDFNNKRYSEDYVPNESDAARMLKLIDLVPADKKVLDIACNDGTITSMIRVKNPDIIAIDISKKAVDLAKSKDISVARGDVLHLPYKNSCFDIVIAGEVIEHIFDTDAFLLEIRRVLKLGGSIIITTPNLASFQNRIKVLFGLQPYCCEINTRDAAGHIRAYTADGLNKLLSDNGYFVYIRKSDFVYIPLLSSILRQTKIDRWLGDVFSSFGVIIIFQAVK